MTIAKRLNQIIREQNISKTVKYHIIYHPFLFYKENPLLDLNQY